MTSMLSGIKSFTFEEFVEAIKSGHSIKRLTQYNGKFVPTRFLTIDIDNTDGSNVTADEILPLVNENCIILNSTSQNPYKWHIYINLFKLCYTTEDLYNETKNWITNLENRINRSVEFDEKLTNTWRSMDLWYTTRK